MRFLAVFGMAILLVGWGKNARGGPADKPAKGQPIAPQPSEAEAQYKGKGVSFWARQLRDKDLPTRTAAAKALEALGAQAKAATVNLKTAITQRAWELWLTSSGGPGNPIFEAVGKTIGGTSGRALTKDEIIADLRGKLADKQVLVAHLRKQLEDLATDSCMSALVRALAAVDQQELEAMAPPAVQASNNFGNVGKQIGK